MRRESKEDGTQGLSLSFGQGLGWEQERVKPVRDKNKNTQRQQFLKIVGVGHVAVS